MKAWLYAQGGLLLLSLPLVHGFVSNIHGNRVVRAYGAVVLFGFVWALGQYAENCILLFWPSEAAYWAALRVTYIGMCGLGPALIHLAWCYTGNYRYYRSQAAVAALIALGLFFYLCVVTNDLHHLYYQSFSMVAKHYGPVFYVFTVYSYACFAYACLSMCRVSWAGGSGQGLYVLLCFGLPVLANTLGMVFRDPALDITVPSYFAMLAGAHLFVRHHHPTNLAPIAAKEIFDTLRYPVEIVGADGSRLYANAEAAALYSLPTEAEIGPWQSPQGRTYLPALHQAKDGEAILTLDDITELTALLSALCEQQAALHAAQEKLKVQNKWLREEALSAREVAAEEQRARVLMEIDREVLGKLEKLTQSVETSISRPEPQGIQHSITLSVDTLKTVRDLINTYKRKAP